MNVYHKYLDIITNCFSSDNTQLIEALNNGMSAFLNNNAAINLLCEQTPGCTPFEKSTKTPLLIVKRIDMLFKKGQESLILHDQMEKIQADMV